MKFVAVFRGYILPAPVHIFMYLLGVGILLLQTFFSKQQHAHEGLSAYNTGHAPQAQLLSQAQHRRNWTTNYIIYQTFSVHTLIDIFKCIRHVRHVPVTYKAEC